MFLSTSYLHVSVEIWKFSKRKISFFISLRKHDILSFMKILVFWDLIFSLNLHRVINIISTHCVVSCFWLFLIWKHFCICNTLLCYLCHRLLNLSLPCPVTPQPSVLLPPCTHPSTTLLRSKDFTVLWFRVLLTDKSGTRTGNKTWNLKITPDAKINTLLDSSKPGNMQVLHDVMT